MKKKNSKYYIRLAIRIMHFLAIKITHFNNYLVFFRHYIWHKYKIFFMVVCSYASSLMTIELSCEPEIVYTNYNVNCLHHHSSLVSASLS
jgi:hypothetical protein